MPAVFVWPWNTPTALSCDLGCPRNRGKINVLQTEKNVDCAETGNVAIDRPHEKLLVWCVRLEVIVRHRLLLSRDQHVAEEVKPFPHIGWESYRAYRGREVNS